MLARCDGTRSGYRLLCNGSVYQCVCGHTGCVQSKDAMCSKQGFSVLGKCVACGAVGKQTLLAPESVGFRRTLMQDPQTS
jgi:hypothetical protein